MPMNQALKGKEYQDVSIEVIAADVTQFAGAVGEDRDLFRSAEAARDAGYAEQVAPPTFVTRLQILASAQVVLDQELGLDYMRVVHGEQEFEWRRAVVVGDRLTAKPRIADIYAKGPNEFLVIEAEIVDAAGEAVVISRGTLLSRGTSAG